MEEDKIEHALMDLGLQRYEAEVYRVLVELGEATVREIATKCSVPREKIYFILKNLEQSGIVRLVEKEPKKYIPLPPAEIFRKALIAQRRKYEIAERVIDYLQKIYEDSAKQLDKRELKFWELGRDTSEKIISIIEGTSRSLYMVIPPVHIVKFSSPPIYEKLKRLAKKGIDVDIYTWFEEEFVKAIGKLTNVGRVFISGGEPWTSTLIISDYEKGQLVFENNSSIYFINRRMAEFYMDIISEMEKESIEFEELDRVITLDDVEINNLFINPVDKWRFYDTWLTNLILETFRNSKAYDEDILSSVLYESFNTLMPINNLSIDTLINLVSYFSIVSGSKMEILYSKTTNTLQVIMPWSIDLENYVSEGITIPPSPWILLLIEHLRRSGYKLQTSVVIYHKDEGKYLFLKHFIKDHKHTILQKTSRKSSTTH